MFSNWRKNPLKAYWRKSRNQARIGMMRKKLSLIGDKKVSKE
jgi:hypothetical protein